MVLPSSSIALPRASAPRVAAAISAILTLLLSLVTAIPSAHATANTDIIMDEMSLISSDANGVEQTQKIYVSGVAKLKFKFRTATPYAVVHPGDHFVIGFPEQFEGRDSAGHRFDLKRDGTKVGECEVQNKSLTCTFGDELNAMDKNELSNLTGSGEFLLSATAEYQQETINFTVNGKETEAKIPGGIITRSPQYSAFDLNKYATPIGPKNAAIPWYISFNTENLAKKVGSESKGKSGKSTIFDGRTEQTLTFTDRPGPGITHVKDPKDFRLFFKRSKDAPDSEQKLIVDGAQHTANGFTMEVLPSDTDTIIRITGPWQANASYVITAPTTVEGGNAKQGVMYTNDVDLDINGTLQTAHAEIHYTETGRVDVNLEPGFSSVSVEKRIEGDATSLVPADAKFNITVDYKLPEGRTFSDYPGWKPVGTPNADKTGGTVTLEAALGKTEALMSPLPKGSVVTLSENLDKAPASDKIAWDKPKFAVGNNTGEKISFTTEGGKVTAATLTNHANKKAQTKFNLVKKINPAGLSQRQVDALNNSDFALTYRCVAPQGSNGKEITKTVTAKPNTPVETEVIPEGYTCTFSEDMAKAARDGFAEPKLTISQNDVKVGADAKPEVEFINSYTKQAVALKVTKDVRIDGALNDTDKKNLAEFQKQQYNVSYRCVDPADDKAPAVASDVKVAGNGQGVDTLPIPVGYTCTFNEDLRSAARDGYGEPKPTIPGPIIVEAGKKAEAEFVNTYPRLTGDITLTKTVTGIDAAKAPASFTFAYKCSDGTTGTKDIKPGAPVPLGIAVPYGTTCDITETNGAVAGYDLKLAQAHNVPVNAPKVNVEVKNAYNKQPFSQFAITKNVEGAEAAKNKTYEFDVTCGDEKFTMKVPAGQTVTYEKEFKPNTKCTATEKTESAEIPGYSHTVYPQKTQEITLGVNTICAVEFTNKYTEQGSFTLTKQVGGTAAPLNGGKKFNFTASWINPMTKQTETKDFTLGDGDKEEFKGLPVGTVVTIQEKKPDNTVVSEWNTPGFATDNAAALVDNGNGTATITVQAGSFTAPTPVKVTNTANIPWWWLLVPLVPLAIGGAANAAGSSDGNYTAQAGQLPSNSPSSPAANGNEKGMPKASEQAQPQAKKEGGVLANTGASVIGLSLIAMLVLALGVGLMIAAKRRKN